MTRPPFDRLLLAGSLLLAPMLALTQEVAPPLEHLVVEHSHAMQGLYMRIIPMAFIVVLTALVMLFAHQRQKQRNEILARYIDKGQDVPAVLLPQTYHSRQGSLRRGVVLTCLAAGLALALLIADVDDKAVAWSLIPLALGVASFINALFLYPKSESGA